MWEHPIQGACSYEALDDRHAHIPSARESENTMLQIHLHDYNFLKNLFSVGVHHLDVIV